MRRSLAISPRVPFDSVTRSMVTGFFSGNVPQPESSGPAFVFVLNHTSWVVMYTWVNCEGVLPVAETLVREEQPENAPHSASRAPPVNANPIIWDIHSLLQLGPVH